MAINLDDEPTINFNLEAAISEFLATGRLGPFKRLVENLLAVKPTSTDVERAFSLAGLIMSPNRLRMLADLVDAIMVTNRFYKL